MSGVVDSGSFADDVVLLVSSDSDCLLALRQFAAEYEVGWMRISPTKSEAMVLTQKKEWCVLWIKDK